MIYPWKAHHRPCHGSYNARKNQLVRPTSEGSRLFATTELGGPSYLCHGKTALAKHLSSFHIRRVLVLFVACAQKARMGNDSLLKPAKYNNPPSEMDAQHGICSGPQTHLCFVKGTYMIPTIQKDRLARIPQMNFLPPLHVTKGTLAKPQDRSRTKTPSSIPTSTPQTPLAQSRTTQLSFHMADWIITRGSAKKKTDFPALGSSSPLPPNFPPPPAAFR